MNKDQIKGVTKDVEGKLQQKAGHLVGSINQQMKGQAKQAEGKAQKSHGDAREASKNDDASRKP